MWWSIWKARNDWLHKGKLLDTSHIIELVNIMLQDHITHGMNNSLRKDGIRAEIPKVYLAKKML